MLDSFQDEQPIIYKTVLNAINKDTVSHAYLIELNGYSKGFDFALALSKFLLCPNHYTNNQNCGNCSQCQTIDSNNFLELKIIRPEGQWIKKEQLEELQQEFNRKVLVGSNKIYIIDGAEKLNASSANSILKFLEEPVPGIIAILITDNAYQVMNTILSRCQVLSLKKNKVNNDVHTTLDALGNFSFHNKDELDNFVNNAENKDLIDKVVEYIKFFEKSGYQAIIYKNKPFIECFNDKKYMNMAFDWMILFYKDILNKMLDRKIEYFYDYLEEIEEISKLTDMLNISKKIEVLYKLEQNIKYNVNSNMLMDKLVIDLMEVSK